MKVAEQIRKTIQCIPESQPFGYADLGIEAADFYCAAKALERLQKKGTIKKVAKGLFYIPRKTIFGELGPDSNGILERNLFENGKRVAYETGFSLYNKLGLTTQMAFKIKIATKKNPIKIYQGTLQVSSVKSYVDITDQNFDSFSERYFNKLKYEFNENIKKSRDKSYSIIFQEHVSNFFYLFYNQYEQTKNITESFNFQYKLGHPIKIIIENLKPMFVKYRELKQAERNQELTIEKTYYKFLWLFNTDFLRIRKSVHILFYCFWNF